MTEQAEDDQRTPVLDAVIVGAGFSGLAVAIELRRRKLRFALLERETGVGGTWWVNRYPGAACDIPSNLYCFSFAPNPAWSRAYPDRAEISAYLADCVERFALQPHLQLGCVIHQARFDEASATWRIESTDGRRFVARALVMATGGLSQPKLPDIAGIDAFRGVLHHSARWPAELDLRGKRVGLIGTGASAIQVLPNIVDACRAVSVFQRTPAWIIPRFNPHIPAWRQRLYRRVPLLQRIVRSLSYIRHEALAIGFTRFPMLLRFLELLPRLHLALQVHDRTLRRRLTPTYRVGCKRVLLANDFYPALQRAHVQLVTEPISHIAAEGVHTADGTLHPCDVLIACTGFAAAEPAVPFAIHGRQGRSLVDVWQSRPSAWMGTCVSGFPNLFLMTGPNTALGHNSMVYMIEAQARYLRQAIEHLHEHPGAPLDVSAQAQEAHNAWLQGRLAHSVWNTGGCRSWYLTRSGENTTLWPDFTSRFRARLRRFSLAPFVAHKPPQ